YIPRPPNAFMLFRADFVKQKHVPGSIEPSHTNLSKIIGLTWKTLPEEEKQAWTNLALKEAAAHRAKYPNYKYQP
ncbi:high mobility group box domain-containing protein, partial [Vararia minispora EC-137]